MQTQRGHIKDLSSIYLSHTYDYIWIFFYYNFLSSRTENFCNTESAGSD